MEKPQILRARRVPVEPNTQDTFWVHREHFRRVLFFVFSLRQQKPRSQDEKKENIQTREEVFPS
jgi:hypothetical protein